MVRINKIHLLILGAFCFGLALRLVLAYFLFGNTDQHNYQIVVEIMERGGNIYAEQAPYPYSPIWANMLFVLNKLASVSHIPFHFAVRGFLSLIDLANALLIGLIAVHQTPQTSKKSSLIYWLNPSVILIVGFHGQFDNLALLPLLIATFLINYKPNSVSSIWIWILGTMSLCIKHITLFRSRVKISSAL